MGAAREERFWLLREPDLAVPYSATAAPVIYPAVLPGLACWGLEFYSFVGSWLHPCANEVLFVEGPLPGIIEWGSSNPYLLHVELLAALVYFHVGVDTTIHGRILALS